MELTSRIRRVWNAFSNRDPTKYVYIGPSSSRHPGMNALNISNERSIINTVFNRIAVDCASIRIEHVQLDENDRFLKAIDSGLNNCLTLEANIDQTSSAFIQDAVMSMFDEGFVALVPIDTDEDPTNRSSYEILTLRVGQIIEWYPRHVKVRVYDDISGKHGDLVMPKEKVCIIENPFYSVMNERNSTMQRLSRKLLLLDSVDDKNSSGKLDLIIQLPFVIKSESRKKQAEDRRKELEEQLAGSQYGIGYIDGSEKITQLNRSIENNLLAQVQYLTSMLFSQLGMTPGILDGTADETTMLNYTSRIVGVIMAAISDEMKRKFLTQNARTRKQTIMFFQNPFRLVPSGQMAEIADKYTRNEILTPNEIRQLVGFKPVLDEQADQLRNRNLNEGEGQEYASTRSGSAEENQNG